MEERYRRELNEINEIDNEILSINLLFDDSSFAAKNNECKKFMEEKNLNLRRLNNLNQRKRDILNDQRRRRADYLSREEISTRAGIRKPCTQQDFANKTTYNGLICSRGPNGTFHWMPIGNIGDPYHLDYVLSYEGRLRGETIPGDRQLQELSNRFSSSPYYPQRAIQTNPMVSKAAQVFQGCSPSLKERIKEEELRKIQSGTDELDELGWQHMVPTQNKVLSNIDEEPSYWGQGGKNLRRKKSKSKKRINRKKRTKRKYK